MLRIWAGRRKTVLFVTHDIDAAVFLADRVIVMTPCRGRMALEERVELPRLTLGANEVVAPVRLVMRIGTVLGLAPEEEEARA